MNLAPSGMALRWGEEAKDIELKRNLVRTLTVL
jgi:hypothetical protein